jgi:hypothetical protein
MRQLLEVAYAENYLFIQSDQLLSPGVRSRSFLIILRRRRSFRPFLRRQIAHTPPSVDLPVIVTETLEMHENCKDFLKMHT